MIRCIMLVCVLFSFCLFFASCSQSPVSTSTDDLNESQTIYETSEDMPTVTDDMMTEITQPEDSEFVLVTKYIPSIIVELKYATSDNFTGQEIYDFSEAYLRYGTIKKLLVVQNILEEQGLGLKIWDAFRPVSAQFALWDACPDPTYVSNPNIGYSSHSKGSAVDVTLISSDGVEVEMPTRFDDFSVLADRDYSDAAEESAANAMLLETTMKENGFDAYFGEWWHFSDVEAYPVEEVFEPEK